MGGIAYQAQTGSIKFLNRALFKRSASLLLEQAGFQFLQINFIFLSDDQLLEINRKFLHHDYFTDIITFNLSEYPDKIDAEVYISNDRVQENAKRLKVSVEDEFLRVMFHGVLHLVGFEDKSPAGRKLMRRMETLCVTLYRELAASSGCST